MEVNQSVFSAHPCLVLRSEINEVEKFMKPDELLSVFKFVFVTVKLHTVKPLNYFFDFFLG